MPQKRKFRVKNARASKRTRITTASDVNQSVAEISTPTRVATADIDQDVTENC